MEGTKVQNIEFVPQAQNQECRYQYLRAHNQHKKLHHCLRWSRKMEWLVIESLFLQITWTAFLEMHMMARSPWSLQNPTLLEVEDIYILLTLPYKCFLCNNKKMMI